jgi:hypothetical protein
MFLIDKPLSKLKPKRSSSVITLGPAVTRKSKKQRSKSPIGSAPTAVEPITQVSSKKTAVSIVAGSRVSGAKKTTVQNLIAGYLKSVIQEEKEEQERILAIAQVEEYKRLDAQRRSNSGPSSTHVLPAPQKCFF